MRYAPELFEAVVYGNPLPTGQWDRTRNAKGQSLMHVAAMHGRLDSLWMLLQAHPILAATPDHDLLLPEDVAITSSAAKLCRFVRKQSLLEYSTL